jgi:hypothetical protein
MIDSIWWTKIEGYASRIDDALRDCTAEDRMAALVVHLGDYLWLNHTTPFEANTEFAKTVALRLEGMRAAGVPSVREKLQ